MFAGQPGKETEMKGQFAFALIVALGSTASATELVRRAPVHTEASDTVVASQGFEHSGLQPNAAFPGSTGCCERQAGCCDNIWEGYCESRQRWCDHPYTGIFPGWGRHGHGGKCGTCSTMDSCNCGGHGKGKGAGHHQKRHSTGCLKGCGKGCSGVGCSYAFGLVAPGPCGGGHGKGHAGWSMPKLHMPKLPKIHMPKVSMPKVSFPKVHLPKFGKGKSEGKGHGPKLHWPKLPLGGKQHSPYAQGPGYGYLNNSMSAPVYLAPEEAMGVPAESRESANALETNLDSNNAPSARPVDPTAARNDLSLRR